MFPGFVTSYIDRNNFKHLYFFNGINDYDQKIYNNIDLSLYNGKYDYIKNIDGSIDYKFFDKNIIKIICKLMKQNNTYNIEILNYK